MTFDLANVRKEPGSDLRDQAANYLLQLYGNGQVEVRVNGKKVDGLFTTTDLGKTVNVFLESKDYAAPLTRKEVSGIWADYSGLVETHLPASLLLVTRFGLTTDAQAYIASEQPLMRHLTIWELENEVLGMADYVRSIANLVDVDGLRSFYIPTRARSVVYDARNSAQTAISDCLLMEHVLAWLSTTDSTPLAVLGGYGAGKTSFSNVLLSAQAERALKDPAARRPVVIRLGIIFRYNSLDGLLSALFTSTYRINGYSYERFMRFNEAGRFLLVLDGFDEMKHAMSWADFRAQVSELTNLICPASKVILLGRPSAFTSEEEHQWILRGRRSLGDMWRRLPDWPEFSELTLEGFSPTERAEFVLRFLEFHEGKRARLTGTQPDDEWVLVRTDEVNEIADSDPALFARPVHAKILTELAADRDVDLRSLGLSVSRWTLYSEFFRALAAREIEKDARKPISEADRITFLRRVAMWLWRNKAGATSFSAFDLPQGIFDGLSDGGAADEEDKRREYLTGALLEKKSGDIYYFPHRSFAEFLVAEELFMHPPEAEQHALYGGLAVGGVAEFLRSSPDPAQIAKWPSTINRHSAGVPVGYFFFLESFFHSMDAVSETIPANSPWRVIPRLLERHIAYDNTQLNKLRLELRTADLTACSLIISLIEPYGVFGRVKPESTDTALAEATAASILERLFACIRDEDGTRLSVSGTAGQDARQLALAAIKGVQASRNGRAVVFSWRDLSRFAHRVLEESQCGFERDGPYESQSPLWDDLELDPQRVLAWVSADVRPRADEYLRAVKGSLQVFVVASGRVPSRRR